jgi:1-deoxyxylulose-5-phosphate synthase
MSEHTFQPRRPLGRTGFRATALGIGDLADRRIPAETLVATLHRALDVGLNLVDTAPMYEDGYGEEVVGRALRGRRDGVFLIDKIDDLTSPVRPQIEASLGRLGLEATDAFVFHALDDPATLERLMDPGGGFDQLDDAIAAGLTRFRGISSHDPDVLVRAMEAGLCDIAMFPVGPFVDDRYVEVVLPLARERGVGTVAFKTFGAGKLVGDTTGYNEPLQARPRGKASSGGVATAGATLPRLSVEECVHYTLTLDPDVALLGLSFPNEQDAAFAAAASFRPLDGQAMRRIRMGAVEARRDKGPCWWNPDPEG